MSKNYDEFYWEKLDNAAKVYPSVTSRKSTNVYRISAKLKENVNPEILQEALNNTLIDLPVFNMKLRRGFFWYYLEKNFNVAKVQQDNRYPCSRIDKFSADGFLFKLTYYNKMINLEIFHVLTDGYGSIFFLKTILLHYFKKLYPDQVHQDTFIDDSELTGSEMLSDSFLKHYRIKDNTDNTKEKSKFRNSVDTLINYAKDLGDKKQKLAYRISGIPVFGDEIKVIHGIVSTKEILTLSKKYNSTVTVYITAVLIYSIYKESFQYNRQSKNIEISIPVNLRNYFSSTSMRNFFSYISTGIDFCDIDMTFEEVIDFVRNDVKNKLKQENLADKIKYNVNAQENIFLKAIPLVLKDFILKIFYEKQEKYLTATVTNPGVIKLPDEISDFVERCSIVVWVNPIQTKKITICSFKDEFVITFSSSIEETSVEQRFFQTLVSHGLDVRISSNYSDESKKKTKHKKEKVKKKKSKKKDVGNKKID